MVNNYFFGDAEEYDGFYEVSSKPRVVKQNTSLQIGYNVLKEAKSRSFNLTMIVSINTLTEKIFNLCTWIPIVLRWHFQTILTN